MCLDLTIYFIINLWDLYWTQDINPEDEFWIHMISSRNKNHDEKKVKVNFYNRLTLCLTSPGLSQDLKEDQTLNQSNHSNI